MTDSFMNNDPTQNPGAAQAELMRRGRFLRIISLALTGFFGLAILFSLWIATQQVVLVPNVAVILLAAVMVLNLVSFIMVRARPDDVERSLERPQRTAIILILVSLATLTITVPLLYLGTSLVVSLACF